ncbi:MAG: non-ribosomal peptide synthetase component F, partial [Alteromonadaceae bacterium]
MCLGKEVMNECVQYPLSSTQEVVWLDQLITPDAPCYNIGGFFVLNGQLDIARFNLAINDVVANHDALRITLTETQSSALQQFNQSLVFQLTRVDFSVFPDAKQRALAYANEKLTQPFNLYESRLWDMQWLKINDDQGYWFFCYHHLVSDGVSVTLIRDAVADAYNRLTKGEILTNTGEQKPAYENFIGKDNSYLSSNRYQKDKSFWFECFTTAPEPLFLKVNDGNETHVVKQLTWRLPQAIFTKITDIANTIGCSNSHFFMAVIAIYFSRICGQRENIVIGMPVHNRSNNEQKKTVGMFSSVIPVSITINPDESFEQTMQALARQLKRVYRHQRFPMSEITRQLRTETSAIVDLYDISLSVEDIASDIEFNELSSTLVPLHNGFEPQPLTIAIQAYDKFEDVLVHFNYDVNFFNTAEIKQHQQRIEQLTLQAVAEPQHKVSQLSLLLKGERQQLLNFNSPTVDYQGANSIHGRFEAQVTKTPLAIAAVFKVLDVYHRLSYEQLNQRSNQVAAYLRLQGIGANTIVGLYCQRSLDFLVGVLGILKAGGAYVPLDPSNPKERLNYMVSDSQVSLILSQEVLRDTLTLPDTCYCVYLDNSALFSEYSAENVANESLPEDLAYMIYTSGSTGQPKGALVHHGGALNHIDAEFDLLGFIKDGELQACNFLQSAASSSDVSVWQFLAPVVSGGKTVILE